MMRLCGRAGVFPIFLELSLTGSAEAHVLRLPAPLKPGADKVDWRALSADTPTVQRSFTFQVRP